MTKIFFKLKPLLRQIFASAFGWIIIAPIAFLVPKRRDWIAVIGRQNGRFLDNAKYFFLQAPSSAPGISIVFITELDTEYNLIKSGLREAFLYPTAQSVWFLMRCGTVVVDEAIWFRKFRFFLLIRAKVVQIWHGIPFKWIELGLWQHETGNFSWASNPWVLRLRLFAYRLTGRRMRYAAVATTSTFYRNQVFSLFFEAEHFPITGYPRNDFTLSLKNENLDLAWKNVDSLIKARISEWRSLGRRLVLVTPTFRDSGAMPIELDEEMLRYIDEFASQHGIELIFKFHPSERNSDLIHGKHFHVCASDSDIYPLFPLVSALVTDYSSISMDFLLIDKPIYFLIPENDDYVCNDRQLQFDPREMMPGPVVSNWRDLLAAILSGWALDTFSVERANLCRKAFDDLPQSEATSKLIKLMCEQRWIRAKTDSGSL